MFDQSPFVRERYEDGVAPVAVFVFDAASGRVSHVNAVAARMFDLSEDRLDAARILAFVPELVDGSERSFETRVATRDGEIPCAVSLEWLRGDAPDVRLVTLQPRAVAPGGGLRPRRVERRQSLWTLVVRQGVGGSEQVRAILREAARGLGLERVTLARVERGELVVDFSDGAARDGERVPLATSLERRAVAGPGIFAVLDTALDPEFADVAGHTRAFLSTAFRVGDQRWLLTFSSHEPVREPFDAGDWEYFDDVVEAVARGVERRASDERVERLAYFDGLTSLPNRIALLKRLDDALGEAALGEKRSAVLFLDIDGFKAVNDTVGHRGGDLVLAEIAQRLRGTLRRDEYIGRLGGDEFAIVMPAIAERSEVESIAQRIGGVLTLPFTVEGYRFSLSASIGVAIFPDDAREREELLACADAAMYAAKDEGGSQVRFCEARVGRGEPAAAAAAGGSSETLESPDPGYVLCYQPILGVKTGRVAAVEALVRRIHPVHGLLAPGRGWSIAADHGGRRALDRWVLREASAQVRAWNAAGIPIRVDVNLAAYDLSEIDMLLCDDELGHDARGLRIEISTAQLGGEGGDRFARFTEHCAQSGIGFVLDGFDGSLSGVAAVSHLPIDALKLERQLVEGILVSRTTRAIVEASVLVARSLGWHVIAKGAETAAQRDALVELDCDAIQGFCIAPPMTAADFAAWLDRGNSLEQSA